MKIKAFEKHFLLFTDETRIYWELCVLTQGFHQGKVSRMLKLEPRILPE